MKKFLYKSLVVMLAVGMMMPTWITKMWVPIKAEAAVTGPVFIDTNLNGIIDPGEQNFDTIQPAVDAAIPSDTIVVTAATYSENVNVNKSLTLKGAGNPIVTAASPAVSVFTVTVSNVNISGLTVSGATGGGQAGIFVGAGVTGSNIHNNNLTGNFDGIWLGAGSSGNTLDSNTLSSNAAQGFELYHSDSNILTNNHADSNTGYGFKMESSDSNTLTNNTANSNSKYGFYLSAGSSKSDNNILTGNTANSNTEYGIRINSSTGNNLTKNTFNLNVAAGLRLKDDITNLMLSDNTITNSPIGVDIAAGAGDVTSWTVNHNNISGNATYGVSNGGAGTLNASSNWWGNSSGPFDNKGLPGTPNYNNPSGTGNSVTSFVDYKPWFTDLAMTTLNNKLPAPTNLIAAAGNGEVSLAWNAVAGAAYYNVSHKKSSDAGFGTPVPVINTTTKIIGLTNGVSYDFQIIAVDGYGILGISAVTTASPVAPTAVKVVATIASQSVVSQVTTTPAPTPTPTVAAPTTAVPIEQGQIKGTETNENQESEKINWTPWIILFILIILAGAATGGYFYWFGKDDEEEIVSAEVLEKNKKPVKKDSPKAKPSAKKSKRW
ncbi:MAG: right-handed parallel beta-helix repeat-containing protein [Candidatus Berkelbacteria bacterium]|nr:right-handed parallel beta-helix repeat-containing protein [Candidatus Berkelbacteria bacterium]